MDATQPHEVETVMEEEPASPEAAPPAAPLSAKQLRVYMYMNKCKPARNWADEDGWLASAFSAVAGSLRAYPGCYTLHRIHSAELCLSVVPYQVRGHAALDMGVLIDHIGRHAPFHTFRCVGLWQHPHVDVVNRNGVITEVVNTGVDLITTVAPS